MQGYTRKLKSRRLIMAVPNQRIIYVERTSDEVRKDYFKLGH